MCKCKAFENLSQNSAIAAIRGFVYICTLNIYFVVCAHSQFKYLSRPASCAGAVKLCGALPKYFDMINYVRSHCAIHNNNVCMYIYKYIIVRTPLYI